MNKSRSASKTAIVAERGQVTIPKAIRDRLGLRQGTVLVFELKNSAIIVTKESASDPVDAVFGCLKNTKYKTTEQYMSEIRGSAK